MNDIEDIMKSFYRLIVNARAVDEFCALMRARAEMITRKIPDTEPANRDIAVGQILICYELADGAKCAFDSSAAKADAEEVAKIRRTIALGDK